MNKKLKMLTVAALAALSLTLVGCGDDDVPETPPMEDGTSDTAGMTKAEYEKYISERYDYYFDNDTMGAQYDMYDIYDDDFDYVGTYDEFITGFNDFYTTDRANLESFRKDIEANYRKGDPDVDKYHNEVITSIDEAMMASDEYAKTFGEKTKDYATYAKDEVVQGLRDLGKVPHEARMQLDKLVEDAKDSLGID